jgi:hypothetical protein
VTLWETAPNSPTNLLHQVGVVTSNNFLSVFYNGKTNRFDLGSTTLDLNSPPKRVTNAPIWSVSNQVLISPYQGQFWVKTNYGIILN